MRPPLIVLAVPLLLVVGCSSTTDSSARAGVPSTSPAVGVTTTTVTRKATTVPPTVLPIVSVPAAKTGSGPATSGGPTGTILMVKLYVSSIAAGEKFYGAVFGAKLALKIGDDAHIETLPKGPGLVLLKSGPDTKNNKGSFIIQVPDLAAAQARAIAHGATVQGKFAGSPGGQGARSVDLLDPWGNQTEILQIG